MESWLQVDCWEQFAPLPIKRLCGQIVLTDGHTRAVACKLAGVQKIPVRWDTDELDEQFYTACVQECIRQNVTGVSTLVKRIIPHEEYEALWYGCCSDLENLLKNKEKR